MIFVVMFNIIVLFFMVTWGHLYREMKDFVFCGA